MTVPQEIYLQQPWHPATAMLATEHYEAMLSAQYKYDTYERALRTFTLDYNTSVIVVGAGFGGLILAALKAGVPEAKISSVEHNTLAHKKLVERFPAMKHSLGDACEVDSWRKLQRMGTPAPTLLVFEMMGSLGCNEAMPEIAHGMLCAIREVYGAAVTPVFVPDKLTVMAVRTKRLRYVEDSLTAGELKIAKGITFTEKEVEKLETLWEFVMGEEVPKILNAAVSGGSKGVVLGTFEAHFAGDIMLLGPHGKDEPKEWHPSVTKGGSHFQRLSLQIHPCYMMMDVPQRTLMVQEEDLTKGRTSAPVVKRAKLTYIENVHERLLGFLQACSPLKEQLIVHMAEDENTITSADAGADAGADADADQAVAQQCILSYLLEQRQNEDLEIQVDKVCGAAAAEECKGNLFCHRCAASGKARGSRGDGGVAIAVKIVTDKASATSVADCLSQLTALISFQQVESVILLFIRSGEEAKTSLIEDDCYRLACFTAASLRCGGGGVSAGMKRCNAVVIDI